MTNQQLSGITFLSALIAEGFGQNIFSSLKEAEKSKKEVAVVIHADGDYFELYVVGFDEGDFGEYVAWNADEFSEEPELMNTVYSFVHAVLSSENPAERIFELNPNLVFTTYDEN